MWLGSRDRNGLLLPTSQSKPVHPSGPAFHPKPLFIFSAITINHCSLQAAAVRIPVLSAASTAPQLQTKTKTEPKLCQLSAPANFLAVRCGCFYFWKAPVTKITRSFSQCLSLHPRFCRSSPHLFLAFIHFYGPASLVHHCEGPAVRN